MQPQGTANSDPRDTATGTVTVNTEGELETKRRHKFVLPASSDAVFDWLCAACDLWLPAEAKNKVRDREEELCHTNTKMYEAPSRRRAVNTDSPTGPRGHSVCVASFLRRTVKRNYRRWSS